MNQGGSRRVLEVAKNYRYQHYGCQQADAYEDAGGPTTVMSARQDGTGGSGYVDHRMGRLRTDSKSRNAHHQLVGLNRFHKQSQGAVDKFLFAECAFLGRPRRFSGHSSVL